LMPLAGSALMLLALTDAPNYWRDFMPGALLFSLGFGVVFAPLTVAALHDVDRADMAQASAVFSSIRQLGGGLGVAVVVAVMGNAARLSLSSLRAAYFAVAVMSALGALIITTYPKRRPQVVDESVHLAAEVAGFE
jgi:hypothetical protein